MHRRPRAGLCLSSSRSSTSSDWSLRTSSEKKNNRPCCSHSFGRLHYWLGTGQVPRYNPCVIASKVFDCPPLPLASLLWFAGSSAQRAGKQKQPTTPLPQLWSVALLAQHGPSAHIQPVRRRLQDIRLSLSAARRPRASGPALCLARSRGDGFQQHQFPSSPRSRTSPRGLEPVSTLDDRPNQPFG